MASIQATPESLIGIAKHIKDGRIRTLTIQPRKSGRNKGVLYVDYTLFENSDIKQMTDRTIRYFLFVGAQIENAARLMIDDRLKELFVKKTDDEKYQYKIEEKEN